jgi:S-adenosylmethionine synthetase
MRIAAAIHERIGGNGSVTVQLLSAIGAPVDRPQLASIEISPAAALTESVRSEARDLANEHLARICEITDLVCTGKVRLF